MIDELKRFVSVQKLFIVLALLIMNCVVGYGGTFSFAILADPHIDGIASHTDNLKTAVDWIIANKESKDIELVFVVGDIAWNRPGRKGIVKLAKGVLDRLDNAGIPYVPIIGDNEIQSSSELDFVRTFDSHYKRLSKVLPGWKKAPTPVKGMYLQNFSFDYKGCHFVCSDFNSREKGNEGGELHDFSGGSWPWFKNDIISNSRKKKENIVIITHIGMFRTGFRKADEFLFSKEEMKKIKGFLWDYRDYVDSNYAGHIHQNWHSTVWAGLFTTIYHVWSTDETWFEKQWPESSDRSATVRVVKVNSSGSKVSYKQHIINTHKP